MADFTDADVDAIDAHLRAVGVVESSEHADVKTTFAPLDDRLKLRGVMKREAAATATGSRSRSRFAAFRKGLR